MKNKRFKIVIVGGGSAGWMTAATLAKTCPNKDITLIESPNIPTVGVGESTLGQINNWLGLLGIEDEDFMRACDATYKLSIRFQDFYKKGEANDFHYPFGTLDTRGSVFGTNDWILNRIKEGNTEPTHTYADWYYKNMLLVNNNKMTDNKDNKFVNFNFKRDVAYHFDSTKFGVWLRDNKCPNIKHIKENIDTIEQDENGIVSLNKKYKADLYIDCTGFRALLIDKALKEPFESYEDILPNNSAWATKVSYTDKKKQMVPYTNGTAIENGWVWRVPLWSRIGTGYVYSNKYVSDEDALKEFKNHLKNKEKVSNVEKLEYRNIKSRVGIHRRIWVKNVVAIGLSAGFIEPLEGNGLYSVHEFLFHLSRILQRDRVSRFDRDAFTYKCKGMFRSFAEFVAMHFALTQRDDTQYWRDIQEREYCKELYTGDAKIYNGFMEACNKRFNNLHYESWPGGLACIATGMHWFPTDWVSVERAACGVDLTEMHADWERGKKQIFDILGTQMEVVKKMPAYYDFLANKIYRGETHELE